MVGCSPWGRSESDRTEQLHFHFSPSCIGEGNGNPLQNSWASLVAQLVKNPSAMWETWVRSLGWEDPLEEGTVTHSGILGLENVMDRGAGGLQSQRCRVRHN